MEKQTEIVVMHLNCWSGRSPSFLAEYGQLISQYDPDIILLNEVFADPDRYAIKHGADPRFSRGLPLYNTPEYNCMFAPRQSTWNTETGLYSQNGQPYSPWGNIMLWKNSRLLLAESRNHFIFGNENGFDHKTPDGMPVNIIGIRFVDKETNDTFVCVNTHGWYGGEGFGKSDCDQRVRQADAWMRFINTMSQSRVVFGGDFNLNIKSVILTQMEKYLGMDNVIKDFNVECTRTPHYASAKKALEPHASYILHRGFKCKDLVVLADAAVSDHAPLIATFVYSNQFKFKDAEEDHWTDQGLR
jgi:hypothetical protein